MQPRLKNRPGIQLLAEQIALTLQPLPFSMDGPVRAEHILDLLHVPVQLALDLARPDNRTRHGGQIVQLRHGVGLGVAILLLEPFMQCSDGLLDVVDELRLVLSNGAADLGPDEERVEFREDAEHLVGVLGRSQPVAQPCDNGVLNARRPLIVDVLGARPLLRALGGDIKQVDVFETLPGLPDLLDGIDIADLLNNGGTVGTGALSYTVDGRLGSEDIDDRPLQLLVVVAEVADILQASLQLRMSGRDLDGDEPLVPPASDIASNTGKLPDVLVPRGEHGISLLHDAAEVLVIKLDQIRARQQAVQHLIQIARDGLDERQGAADGIRTYPQLLVQVRHDLADRVLDLDQSRS